MIITIITELVFSLDHEGDEECQKSQTEDEDRDQEDEVPAETVAIDLAGSTDAQEREEENHEAEGQCQPQELCFELECSRESFIVVDGTHNDGPDTCKGGDEDSDAEDKEFETVERVASHG